MTDFHKLHQEWNREVALELTDLPFAVWVEQRIPPRRITGYCSTGSGGAMPIWGE